MKAEDIQNHLYDLLVALLENLDDDDDDDDDEGEGIRRVTCFEDAGILTMNKGLVIECNDGSEFQLTIIQSALAREDQ
jgi:hypothetical protein